MKKEESIFVTEGYLRRELIAIMFLLEGIGDKRNKRNVFEVELHSSHTVAHYVSDPRRKTDCGSAGRRRGGRERRPGADGRALTTT